MASNASWDSISVSAALMTLVRVGTLVAGTLTLRSLDAARDSPSTALNNKSAQQPSLVMAIFVCARSEPRL